MHMWHVEYGSILFQPSPTFQHNQHVQASPKAGNASLRGLPLESGRGSGNASGHPSGWPISHVHSDKFDNNDPKFHGFPRAPLASQRVFWSSFSSAAFLHWSWATCQSNGLVGGSWFRKLLACRHNTIHLSRFYSQKSTNISWTQKKTQKTSPRRVGRWLSCGGILFEAGLAFAGVSCTMKSEKSVE